MDYLENLDDQVAVCGPDWDIVFVNNAWKRFNAENGGEGRDFIGDNYLGVCTGIEGVEQTYGEEVANGLSGIANGTDTVFNYTYPCNAPHERRWFRLTASKIGGDTLLHHQPIVMRNTNVTADVEFIPEYVQGRIEAEIAHDVKTSLNALVGYVQYGTHLLAQGRSVDIAIEKFKTAEDAGWRLARMLDQIVERSRAASIDQGVELIDLAAIVKTSGHMFAGQYSGITFECRSKLPNDVRLQANEAAIARIVDNLISNAFKYNRPGGSVKAIVHLNAERGLVLTIEDTGLGMDSDAKDRIFSMFSREKSTSVDISGHGVGLASASQLAASLEAHLTVDSIVDEGSAFKVAFPTWRTIRVS